MTSLEGIAAGSDEAGEEIFLFHDVLSNDGEDPSTRAARKIDWQEFVTALPERERRMVEFIIEGKTFRSLGHLLGVGDTGMNTSKKNLATKVLQFMGNDRDELASVLTDGFFPKTAVTDVPQMARRTGLAQMALPYAQDAGVTRHLAAFLTRQARAMATAHDAPVKLEGKTFVHPTAVLFNGGAFKATALKDRVIEVLNGWLATDGGQPAKELEGAELDLAVARGAAYFGWVRHGHGLRIRGGTARAYYVGVETAMPAVPGLELPVKAI